MTKSTENIRSIFATAQMLINKGNLRGGLETTLAGLAEMTALIDTLTGVSAEMMSPKPVDDAALTMKGALDAAGFTPAGLSGEDFDGIASGLREAISHAKDTKKITTKSTVAKTPRVVKTRVAKTPRASKE